MDSKNFLQVPLEEWAIGDDRSIDYEIDRLSDFDSDIGSDDVNFDKLNCTNYRPDLILTGWLYIGGFILSISGVIVACTENHTIFAAAGGFMIYWSRQIGSDTFLKERIFQLYSIRLKDGEFPINKEVPQVEKHNHYDYKTDRRRNKEVNCWNSGNSFDASKSSKNRKSYARCFTNYLIHHDSILSPFTNVYRSTPNRACMSCGIVDASCDVTAAGGDVSSVVGDCGCAVLTSLAGAGE
uniref:Uncharacterized protein n=1 Tax=Romanomermis culicivorax TaxID=13658 RepID=A0A915JSI7_ROMCU